MLIVNSFLYRRIYNLDSLKSNTKYSNDIGIKTATNPKSGHLRTGLYIYKYNITNIVIEQRRWLIFTLDRFIPKVFFISTLTENIQQHTLPQWDGG